MLIRELTDGLFKFTDGSIRYLVNGEPVNAGLVQDEDGSIYYINATLKAVRGLYNLSSKQTNGLAEPGWHSFGTDYKMIIEAPATEPETEPATEPPVETEPETEPATEPETEPTDPNVKNGLVHDEDGYIRYYVDGEPIYAGLVQDEDGSIYYVNQTKHAVRGKYNLNASQTNGLAEPGWHSFGEDYRMKIKAPVTEPETEPATEPPVVTEPETEPATEPETGPATEPETEPATEPETEPETEPVDPNVKNGLVHDEDGYIRYYVNGEPIFAGLVQDEDGSIYYVNQTKHAVRGKYNLNASLTNGLAEPGWHSFGEDYKMKR